MIIPRLFQTQRGNMLMKIWNNISQWRHQREEHKDIWKHLLQTKTIFIEAPDAATHGKTTKNMCFSFMCGLLQKQPIWKSCSLFYPSDCPVRSIKNINSTPKQHIGDRNCVKLSGRCARFPPVLACSCSCEAGVIQAVSGSCDLKHPAQQLETTYITQLCSDSTHGGSTDHDSREKYSSWFWDFTKG